MNAFPSNKIMMLTILILTCVYGVKFAVEGKKQFFQLNFDWGKEERIQNLGEVYVDSISYNFISLDSLPEYPNPELTYKLTKNDKIFYFRYVYVIQKKSRFEFHGVEWITDIPHLEKTNYFLETVNLPLKARGPSVITIGDEYTFENEGKYLRKDILSHYTTHFKGPQTDVFNLKYAGRKGINSTDILHEISSLEPADFYILFFGKNEIDLFQFEENSSHIIEKLSLKNPKKILWITMPPVQNDSLQVRYRKINRIIDKHKKHPKIEVIVTSELLSDSIKRFIRDDGSSVSRDGYFRIAKLAAKMIKNAN